MSPKTAIKTDDEKDVTMAEERDEAPAKTPEAETLLGQKTFHKAVALASQALNDVSNTDNEIKSLDAQILQKKEGASARIKRLAVDCVKLTAKDGKAMLKNAAVLFRDSCAQARAEYMQAWGRANPGVEGRFNQIVPSWPALVGDAYNAMFKADINPTEFDKPTAFRDAYREWRAKPENAGEVDGRGARQGSGPLQQAAAATMLIEPEKVKEFSNELKTSIRTLLGELHGLDEEGQTKAIVLLDGVTEKLRKLHASIPANQGGRQAPRQEARVN